MGLDASNMDDTNLMDNNAKQRTTELIFNSEIKNYLDALPEPYHTYLLKVKKWQAKHPSNKFDDFCIPKNIQNDINKIRLKLMQLKIGGLKEEYGFSSGVKFKLDTVIQAIASGKGLTSKDKPFIRLTSDITHSVTILIDFSSSMQNYIEKIKESVYVFSEVLNKLQLSFSIYGYSESFWIIKDFSEKWDLNAKCRLFGLKAKGMGPESVAINTAAIMTQRVIEKGKVMFLISDGIFEDRNLTKRMIQSVRKMGIVIIGISLFADISDVFPVNILDFQNLNEIWSADSIMRIYSKEFQTDY